MLHVMHMCTDYHVLLKYLALRIQKYKNNVNNAYPNGKNYYLTISCRKLY